MNTVVTNNKYLILLQIKQPPFNFFCGVLYKTIGKGVHFCMYISIIDAETFV